MKRLPLMRLLLSLLLLCHCSISLLAGNRIYAPEIKTLQAVVNDDWLSPAVMRLNSDDWLQVSFDELSHDDHRYIYRLQHCEVDWTPSDGLFETDWLEGFNDVVIDDFERSINTTVPYTHYQFTIPNDRCRPRLSGNYRLDIIDEESELVLAKVEFMITEQAMPLAAAITTNTDIDVNRSHQQLSFSLNYGHLSVTDPQQPLQTVVMQNNREDNLCRNVPYTSVSSYGLEWHHCRQLIFDGGNEYRKFEILDPSHPTMGIDRIIWDGQAYQAFPFLSEPRPNYIYDPDANGSFLIRNSDNREIDITCDYVWVNYRLRTDHGDPVIAGRWTIESPETYRMTYDPEQQLYTARILQKQGYYSYQYLGVPSEGNFYQTENSYQIYVYYKGIGERTWRLVAFNQLSIH